MKIELFQQMSNINFEQINMCYTLYTKIIILHIKYNIY